MPILPFEGEELDNQLYFLTQTLMEIKDYDDVRDFIRGRYMFESLSPETKKIKKMASERANNDSLETISTN